MIHISLFEASPVICEALVLFLATQPDFEPVALHDVDQLLVSVAPGSLVLLSIDSLPGDLWSMISRITSQVPSAHVVLLSLDESQGLVARALVEGAGGFIHKRAEPLAFLDALRRIAGGETVVLDASGVSGDEGTESSADPASLLTHREVEVIRLLAQDHTARQVASALGVSTRTVHVHLQNAYRKLGVHGRIGAILEAVKKGFLEDDWFLAIGLIPLLLDWLPG